MTILHEETYYRGHLRLRVLQEWPHAGLRWEYVIEAGILPKTTHRSSGAFYQDTDGERIHGATVEDVVETALAAVRSLFPNLPEVDR